MLVGRGGAVGAEAEGEAVAAADFDGEWGARLGVYPPRRRRRTRCGTCFGTIVDRCGSALEVAWIDSILPPGNSLTISMIRAIPLV